MTKREMVWKLFLQADKLSLQKCRQIIEILEKEGMVPPKIGTEAGQHTNWENKDVYAWSKDPLGD